MNIYCLLPLLSELYIPRSSIGYLFNIVVQTQFNSKIWSKSHIIFDKHHLYNKSYYNFQCLAFVGQSLDR